MWVCKGHNFNACIFFLNFSCVYFTNIQIDYCLTIDHFSSSFKSLKFSEILISARKKSLEEKEHVSAQNSLQNCYLCFETGHNFEMKKNGVRFFFSFQDWGSKKRWKLRNRFSFRIRSFNVRLRIRAFAFGDETPGHSYKPPKFSCLSHFHECLAMSPVRFNPIITATR